MGADNSSPGQDEAYSFYSGMAMQIGQALGAPTSGQYQSARPGDFSSPAARDRGSSGFSSPPGINTSSLIFNLLGNSALNSWLGNDFQYSRPFGQDAYKSTQDFIEGRQRAMQSQAMMKDILKINAPYYAPRIGNASNVMGMQMIFDALNPGGSQYQAFNQIYSNQGKAFGVTEEQRSGGALEAIKQMTGAFTETSGLRQGEWDFRRSYGYDSNQTAEGVEVAIRRNIGKNMTNEGFAAAVSRGEGGNMMKENNRMFQAASELFGRDKGLDQLGESISDMVDGANNMDPSKIAALLQKINATRKSVDMSSEAFSEYSKLLTDMYRSMGISGSAVTGSVLNSIRSAEAATKSGDPLLGDRNKNMENAGILQARNDNSPHKKMLKAAFALASNLTNEQMATIQINGVGTMASAIEALKKATDEGDTDTQAKIVAGINSSQNRFFGLGSVSKLTKNWSSAEEERAKKVYDTSDLENSLFPDFTKFVNRGVAEGIDKNIMKKIGPKGFQELADEMETSVGATNREKVAEIIKKKKGMGLTEEEQSDLASQFALAAQKKFADSKDWGFTPEQSALAYKEGGSKGRAARKKQIQEERKSAEQAKRLAEISGDVMRPFGEKEALKEVLNIIAEVHTGALKKEDFTQKDGSFDFEKIGALVTSRTKKVLKTDEVKRMTKAAADILSPETSAEIEKAGKEAYDKAGKSGASQKEMEAAKNEAQKNKSDEIVKKSLEKSFGEEDKDQNNERAKNSATEKTKDTEKEGDEPSSTSKKNKAGSGSGNNLGDNGNGSEKVDALVSEAKKHTGILNTIAEKLPDSNKIASASKPNSAPSKATTLERT